MYMYGVECGEKKLFFFFCHTFGMWKFCSRARDQICATAIPEPQQ